MNFLLIIKNILKVNPIATSKNNSTKSFCGSKITTVPCLKFGKGTYLPCQFATNTIYKAKSHDLDITNT